MSEVPQSHNATENNETTQNSHKQVCQLWRRPILSVTKELANALSQGSASILDQRRRQIKNEDRRSNGGASCARAPANELIKSTALVSGNCAPDPPQLAEESTV